MNFLKTLPLAFRGELHTVQLCNFSVDPEEVRPWLPEALDLKLMGGRAIISMVTVDLQRMRPVLAPPCQFNYPHVGLRLLLDDRPYNGTQETKGIFFMESFTDQPLVIAGGGLLTNFRLHKAKVRVEPEERGFEQDDLYLRYKTTGKLLEPTEKQRQLLQEVGRVDRAYAVNGKRVYVTAVEREHWPLELVECTEFETNYFDTARLEGVFRVPKTILYKWRAPRRVQKAL